MQGKTIRCNGKSISKSIDEDLKQRMIHSKLANQVKIHFPPSVSDSPDAYEEIRISANDGERTAYTTICLSRIFKDNGQPDPEPEALPEEAKFKMIMAYNDRLCPLFEMLSNRGVMATDFQYASRE